MRVVLACALGLVACSSDLRRETRAFVAPTPCGQGPYEVTVRAAGMTGGDGVEIVACTPRKIAGHVSVAAGQLELVNHAYGEGADNQRCLGGTPTAITSLGSGGSAATNATGTPAGAATAAAPVLVERPYTGSETPFEDELCQKLGLSAQVVLMPTVLMHTETHGAFDLHIRLWSDAPNDLEGVVFMIRQLTSKQTPAQVAREEAKRGHRDARPVTRTRADHGPPPSPLVEERPAAPSTTATWIAGYWSWTNSTWGWVAGFWRDDGVALPPPRIEVPGAPPAPGAIWIGGSWSLRAGGLVWIAGRWRR